MKIELGLPGLFKVEDDIPSPVELIEAVGSIRENPIKKTRRLVHFVRDYPHQSPKRELSGMVKIQLEDSDDVSR